MRRRLREISSAASYSDSAIALKPLTRSTLICRPGPTAWRERSADRGVPSGRMVTPFETTPAAIFAMTLRERMSIT
jgi:hypothetical protein